MPYRALQSVRNFAAKEMKSGAPMGKAVYLFTNMIIPYTRTPSAVAVSAIRKTPVGALYAMSDVARWVRAGLSKDDAAIFAAQRRLSDTVAESATGTAAMFLGGAYLYNKGIMTADSPSSEAERKAWQDQGKQPYSIKLGDRWLKMTYFAPFGTVLAAGAAWAESERLADVNTRKASQAAFKGIRTLVDQPALQGPVQLGRALTNEVAGRKWAENFAAGITPGAVAGIAQTVDPVRRAPENMMEAVASRLPGLSTFVPPRIGVWGKPDVGDAKWTTRFMRAMVDPTASTRDRTENDPLLAEVVRVGASIPKVERWDGEDTQDYLDRQMTVGEWRRQAVQAAINSEEYRDSTALAESARELMVAKPELKLRTIPQAVNWIRSWYINGATEKATELANEQFRAARRATQAPTP